MGYAMRGFGLGQLCGDFISLYALVTLSSSGYWGVQPAALIIGYALLSAGLVVGIIACMFAMLREVWTGNHMVTGANIGWCRRIVLAITITLASALTLYCLVYSLPDFVDPQCQASNTRRTNAYLRVCSSFCNLWRGQTDDRPPTNRVELNSECPGLGAVSGDEGDR
eukprot:COSAG06_NODE_28_length_32009_cov_31.553463_8_plen_167_part_00